MPILPRTVDIVRATTADAARLATLAAATFSDTFAADNTADDMAAYLAQTFGERRQRDELEAPGNLVLFAERDGQTVGYAMLRDGAAPSCVDGDAPLEIARLYAIRGAIGSGIGSALMSACLETAAERGRDVLWLGVWERNARAIAFYERWGFRDVGSQSFQLGTDRQTDRVMMRRVGEAR